VVPRFWTRGLGIWLMLMLTESANGTFRRIVLDPRVGDVRGRQIAVVTGSLLMLWVAAVLLPALGRHSRARWWGLGLFWVALTLAFELGLGRLFGLSWARLRSDFDPRQGGWLAFGMLFIAAVPRLVAWKRRLAEQGS
jgi:hypothetical protein